MSPPDHIRPSADRALAPLVAVGALVVSGCAFAVHAGIGTAALVTGWLCLVPTLVVLDRVRSVGAALGVGVGLSVAFSAAVFPWFPDAVASYTGASRLLGVALLVLLAPVIEPQFVAFAAARHLARRSAYGRWWRTALVGAGAYVGCEWACPKLFADTLGHALFASATLRQGADLVGAHGLTFALVLGNECVLAATRGSGAGRAPGEATRRPRTAPLVSFALLVGLLAGYGSLRLTQLARSPAATPVRVAVVQANVAHYDALKRELGTFETVRRILDVHFGLSADVVRSARPDLLVWPETVYPTTFGAPKSADGAAFDREISDFVAIERTPLLFGTYGAQDDAEFNVAVLLEPRGDEAVIAGSYRKTRLFPFTEYLPWPLSSETMRRRMPWAGGWSPGPGPRVLSAGLGDGRTLRFAPLICYDAIDTAFGVGAARRGAEVLITLSNDSWFAYPGTQRLILIVSAFRSIETRRPQVRSTPTGISALIDETGALEEVVGPDRRGVMVGTVRPAKDPWTLVLAWGDWLPPTALIGALLLLAAGVRGRPQGRGRAAVPAD